MHTKCEKMYIYCINIYMCTMIWSIQMSNYRHLLNALMYMCTCICTLSLRETLHVYTQYMFKIFNSELLSPVFW